MSTRNRIAKEDRDYRVYVINSVLMTIMWLAVLFICMHIGFGEMWPFAAFASLDYLVWWVYTKIYRETYHTF